MRKRKHSASVIGRYPVATLTPVVFLVALYFVLPQPPARGHDDHTTRSFTLALGLANVQPTRKSSRPGETQVERIDSGGGVFHTVSLAPLANVRLEQPDQWKDRIWKQPMRGLPRGRQTFAGIPFFVIPATENQGLAAVALVGGRYQEGPSGGGAVAVSRTAKAIYVLHTASYQNINSGRVMARYVVTYADGTDWEIPVRNKLEAADFMENENLTEDCVIGWSAKHPFFRNYYGVYVARLVNPHPDKEIASFEFRPSKGAAVVSVIGLTLGEGAPALTRLKGVKQFQRPNLVQGARGRLEMTIQAEAAPTAARVVVEGPHGKAYQPLDGLNYFMLGRGKPFFYANARCSLEVPAGNVKVSLAKGFEYQPIEFSLDVPEGETVERRVMLRRWINLPELGWYSGEMHIHPFDQEPEDTAVCILAEDLHVANLLIWGNGFTTRYHGDQFFRGRPESWPDATHRAYYNEEFRNNTYGHLCLIDLRSLVYPMGTGREYRNEDYPANAVIMDRTHEQGAFVSVAHMSIPPVNYAVPWEVSVDVALGKADSIDIDLRAFKREEDRSLDLWYRLLNCGFEIPATCGTDSFMNRSWTNIPAGNLRTYCHLGDRFSYRGWVDAARRGRSFVTKGPALFLRVDEKLPGATIRLKPGENQVLIRAEAQSLHPLRRLEVLVNGKVVASAAGRDAAPRLAIEQRIELDGAHSAWIVARTQGESSKFFLHKELFAHTNPIYCAGAEPLRSPADAQFFVGEIDRLLDWVQTKGVFDDPAHREEVKAIFQKARALYEKQARR